jgi:hypothetical protein
LLLKSDTSHISSGNINTGFVLVKGHACQNITGKFDFLKAKDKSHKIKENCKVPLPGKTAPFKRGAGQGLSKGK